MAEVPSWSAKRLYTKVQTRFDRSFPDSGPSRDRLSTEENDSPWTLPVSLSAGGGDLTR